MTKLLSNPTVRLITRAIVAGVLAFLAQIQASDNLDATILRSAAVAGLLAAVEYFTPVNALVGLNKTSTPAKK